ncbi:MAG TPA: hypothetical protein EYM84_04700, partial [Flavobacteriales bacterium]|nr:hypothetical protein [Flavobacteriales bacterium]
MKKVIITQSNYIPWKGYFDSIRHADEFVMLDDVQYTKRDWRNRNKIKSPNGIMWLTIPVEVRGKFTQSIKDTRIADPDWAKKHWKTIQLNYGKAKYFKQYSGFLENLYGNARSEWLTEINHQFIKAICAQLDIDTVIRYSSEFQLLNDPTTRLVEIC